MNTDTREGGNGWRGDATAAVCLFVVVTAFAAWYLITQVPSVGYAYRLSTEHFAAAAMYGSGAGYFNPDRAQVPGLDDFLNERTNTFTLSGPVPENARLPLSWFHHDHAYLMHAVALAWRVFGVSWTVFRLVIALLAGCLAVTAFGVLRLAAGRGVSAVFALVFMVSPAALTVMPNIRDFAKAPFILAACGLCYVLAVRPLGNRARAGMAVAMGLLIGLGVGFRSDVLVCVPPALIALACSTGGTGSWRAWGRSRGIAVALCCFVLAAFGAPILFNSAPNDTASAAHDIICGLSTESDTFLGVEPASYERVYYFWDGFAHAIANSYAHRVLGVQGPVPYNSPASGDAQEAYVLQTFCHFPGDIVARAYASGLRILGGGFARVEEFRAERTPYGYPDNAFIDGIAPLYRMLAFPLEQFKIALMVLALGLLAARSPRAGFAALLLGLYFTGYACLQFHLRHYFHLTLFTLWPAALLLQSGIDASRRLRAGQALPAPLPYAQRFALFTVTAALLVAAPLWLGRAVQAMHVGATLNAAESAALQPLATIAVPEGDRVLHRLEQPLDAPPLFEGDQVWEVQGDYLAVELVGSEQPRVARISYDSETPFNDFSHEVVIPPLNPGGTVRYFFPVYQSLHHSVAGEPNPTPGFDGRWGLSRFAGIALAADADDGFRGLYRVENTAPFPLFYNFVSSSDNAGFRYWQDIDVWREP
ncbi:MAG: hypothetical protein GC168_12750 [Candidatus Hydrogenedens sp.]|nr:hypothetical protein [Candidatus Hydrogenedens sp.]